MRMLLLYALLRLLAVPHLVGYLQLMGQSSRTAEETTASSAAMAPAVGAAPISQDLLSAEEKAKIVMATLRHSSSTWLGLAQRNLSTARL
jgi:hypothetical protein